MEDGRIHTGQSALIVTALVCALPALLIGLASMIGGLFVVTTLAAAFPLCFRSHPQEFAWACSP